MYHEYPGPNDTIIRRHFNGRRVPNQDIIPFDSFSEQLFREASPDGRIWSMAAQSAMKDLSEILGDAYAEFAELTWPGASIEELTWQQICQMADNAYFQAKYHGVRDVTELSRAAYLVEGELGTFDISIADIEQAEAIGQ